MSDVTFPETVRCRSSIVTIYHVLNRGKDHFTLSFYDANGKRQRRMFRDYDTAKESAKSIAGEIAAGGSDVLTLSGRERLCYERAIEILRPLNTDVDTAIMQLAEAVKVLNGTASLVEAARHYIRQHSTKLPIKSVREVADEMLDEKTKAGLSIFHLRDLRWRLTRFADAFRCPLASVTAVEIQQFLLSQNTGFRSRRNFRQTIGTLFNFAKAHHYLKLDHPGISEVPKVPKRGHKIPVFSPEEMTKLLSGAKRELIPAFSQQPAFNRPSNRASGHLYTVTLPIWNHCPPQQPTAVPGVHSRFSDHTANFCLPGYGMRLNRAIKPQGRKRQFQVKF